MLAKKLQFRGLFLLVPFFALLVGVAFAGSYMNWGNPNVQFQRKVVAEQFEGIRKSEEASQRVLVVGGSNVSFSIQPELLKEEFGLEVLNMGLPAGTGRGLHCEWALQEVRAGDIVVLTFESTGWTEAEETLITPLGSQFWYLTVGPHYGWKSKLSELPVEDQEERYRWTDIRPGGKHLVTLAAKVAFRQPLFRYTEKDLHAGGYLKGTSGWGIQPGGGLLDLELAPMQRELLKGMKARVEEQGAQLVISLPWRLTKENLLEQQRSLNQKLISQLSQHAPVLDDPRSGACSQLDWYADTHWHLTEVGAQERSRAFGKGLLAFGAQGS